MLLDRGSLNFNHLYYFHVVASAGSVRGAAEQLGVTQPTISEQLRALERALGVQLFERGAAGLRLTSDGRAALEHTTPMFRAGEKLVEVLGRQGAASMVELRVGVSAAVSRTMAAGFLAPLLTVDECRPSIKTAEFPELLQGLRSHELDLVLCEMAPLDRSSDAIETAIVARPVMVAIAHPTIEPCQHWDSLSLLEYPVSSAYHWEVDAYLEEHGLRPRSVADMDDAFLMLEAVERGAFVAFVPRQMAKVAIEAGRVRALSSFRAKEAAVHAIYPSSQTLAAARSAVERLIENARDSLE